MSKVFALAVSVGAALGCVWIGTRWTEAKYTGMLEAFDGELVRVRFLGKVDPYRSLFLVEHRYNRGYVFAITFLKAASQYTEAVRVIRVKLPPSPEDIERAREFALCDLDDSDSPFFEVRMSGRHYDGMSWMDADRKREAERGKSRRESDIMVLPKGIGAHDRRPE